MVFVNLIWIDWTHVLWSHGTLSSPFSTEETWTTLLLLLFQIFHRNQGRAQWLAGYVGLVGFNKGRVAQPAQPGQAPALFSLIEGWHSPVFWRVAGLGWTARNEGPTTRTMHNVLRRGDRGLGGGFLGIVPHQQQDQACHDIFVLSDFGHHNPTK